MVSIDRAAIVVKPGRRFLEWLHAADPTSAGLTLEDLQKDASVYLVEDSEDDLEGRKRLAKVCHRIFEEQLEGWWRDPSSWPRHRGMTEFEHWFEWSIHSLVFDLFDAPIHREPH